MGFLTVDIHPPTPWRYTIRKLFRYFWFPSDNRTNRKGWHELSYGLNYWTTFFFQWKSLFKSFGNVLYEDESISIMCNRIIVSLLKRHLFVWHRLCLQRIVKPVTQEGSVLGGKSHPLYYGEIYVVPLWNLCGPFMSLLNKYKMVETSFW